MKRIIADLWLFHVAAVLFTALGIAFLIRGYSFVDTLPMLVWVPLPVVVVLDLTLYRDSRRKKSVEE